MQWVSREVTGTKNRGETVEYVVQIAPEIAASDLSHVNEGDLVVLKHEGETLTTEIQARLQVREHVDPELFAVDETLRCALGVDNGSKIAIGAYHDRRSASVKPIERLRRWLNGTLGIRTEVCRVKMSVNPDLENRVCRLPHETLQLLGIQPGDQVILSTPMARPVAVKALPISEDTEERTEKMEKKAKEVNDDTDVFVPSNCATTLDLKSVHATDDIPSIHLDQDLRTQLGLQQAAANYGLCKPVRVSGDSTDFIISVFHDLSVPIVLGAIGLVVGLDSLSPTVRIGLMVGSVVFAILFAVLYRSRRF
jgi:hypothetical protein